MNDEGNTTITEQQFSDYCEDKLRKLADEVRSSGMTIYEIARRARLQWRTVKKVVDCVPVRWDTAERIRLVIAASRNRHVNDTTLN